MQKSEKFFIFSWKELMVLALVAITAMGFFFTLGLHYGKQMVSESHPTEEKAANLEPSPEAAPPKETLSQGAHHVESAATEAIEGATEKAIEETHLKVDQPKPVDLPEAKGAPKAEVKAQAKPEMKADLKEAGDSKKEVKPEVVAEASVPKFAIQLGSYPSAKEAQKRIGLYAKRGLKAEMRTAVVNSETRYRVVFPGFKTAKLADHKGKELKTARKIESYVVIKTE